MKLHLRDLFWLVLVVAMGCAWWLDRRSETEKHRQELSVIGDEIATLEVRAWDYEERANGFAKFLRDEGYDVDLSQTSFSIEWHPDRLRTDNEPHGTISDNRTNMHSAP